jgi:imidazolonepropionase-like amidohydrolase
MPSSEPLVVLAGRLVDVAAGDVLDDRALVLDGERIREVLPSSEAPSGPRTIDLSARTVLPGLIDSHAHLIGQMDGGQGYGYLVNRSSAQEALTGVTNALATLLGGVTTVRDVGTFHAFVDLALREAIEDGRIAGPRMMCAGA